PLRRAGVHSSGGESTSRGHVSSINMIEHESSENYIVIRGRRLGLEQLLTPDITSPDLIAGQRQLFHRHQPFAHICIAGLFNEQLLRLIKDEFPSRGASGWRNVSGRYESTYRSRHAASLSPAAQIYFNLVNSNAFVCYLSAITGIPDLIVDHTLLGGGLHE